MSDIYDDFMDGDIEDSYEDVIASMYPNADEEELEEELMSLIDKY